MTSTPPSPASSFSPSVPTKPTTSAPSSASTPGAGQGTATGTGAPPVQVLSTKPARVYSLVHPLTLLGCLAARFSHLVTDPVAELVGDLPYLAALQVIFVAVCLPAAGGSNSHSHSHGHGHGHAGVGGSGTGTGTGSGTDGTDEDRDRKKVVDVGRSVRTAARRRAQQHGKGGGEGVWVKVVPALISLTLTTLLATPAFTILLVLFGAPLTTHHFETVLCAAHMALLAATPLVYVHGVDATTWREVWGVNRPADIVWGGALGTGVGAWFGAVPIPLDWDRPWQAYPITILTGAYLGFVVGSLICRLSWVYGKRIQFVPEDDDHKAEKVE